jgi:hypothetical protein
MDNLIKTQRLKSHIVLLLLFLTAAANAAVIKGRITDLQTHKPIQGAAVSILDSKIVVISDTKGEYVINNLKPGSYSIVSTCMGYKSSGSIKINLGNADSEVVSDFNLEHSFIQINEVVVTGIQNKETNSSARHDERVSSNVVSIISAKTIEALPDLTVANVLQRVSGVSMMKNSSGNNTQLVIRGMSPRYNSTLVNGTIVPTTSGSTRAVPMDIFPSVFVGRIEVTKALTPDMEASGLGGLANIVMKNALILQYFRLI